MKKRICVYVDENAYKDFTKRCDAEIEKYGNVIERFIREYAKGAKHE